MKYCHGWGTNRLALPAALTGFFICCWHCVGSSAPPTWRVFEQNFDLWNLDLCRSTPVGSTSLHCFDTVVMYIRPRSSVFFPWVPMGSGKVTLTCPKPVFPCMWPMVTSMGLWSTPSQMVTQISPSVRGIAVSVSSLSNSVAERRGTVLELKRS